VSLRGHTREIVLSFFLVVLLFYLFRPATPPAAPAAESPKADAKQADPVKEVAVIQRLSGAAGEYQGGGRNLFDYGVIQPPPPSPEEVARAQAEAAKRREADEQARAQAEALRQQALAAQLAAEEAARAAQVQEARLHPPAPPKPVPPACDLKLFGLVGERGKQIAIFVDSEGFVMAREGETVKKEFRVDRIGYDSLQLGYTDPRFASEHLVLTLGTSS
jgi:multidrug efflux pump subunit AcrA (membrane-fusion protein)